MSDVGADTAVEQLAETAVGLASAVEQPAEPAGGLASGLSAAADGSYGFRATSRVVLDYLNACMPMAFWSVTRVENDRQTFIYVDENELGLTVGGSIPWQDSYCVHMVAGTAPRIAPDSASIPEYAAAPVNEAVQIGAYAGAPIVEPDGTTFGVICGADHVPRADLAGFGPLLDAFSELLTISLAADRALNAANRVSSAAMTYANTDSLTRTHNRRAWDETIHRLQVEYSTYADPTVIVIVDLDNLKAVNDGPGGHTAGDQLLRNAVEVMRRNIRDDDFLARLGGDEFGIILAPTPADLAPAMVDRLTYALDLAGTPASVGWSPLVPDGTVARAVELADRAMYQAKHGRKNRVPRT